MRTISTLQEFHMDLSKIYNWLPWGGLVYPQVVRNKDNSLMGFIRYTTDAGADASAESEVEKITAFKKGWAIWVDLQHYNGQDTTVLTLCWNPFREKKTGRLLNALNEKVYTRDEAERYFITVLNNLQKDLSATVKAEILEYAEILGYLKSTLSGKPAPVEMYSPPLYLDAVLSKDVDFQLFGSKTKKKNDLAIDGHEVTVVTPLGFQKMPIMGSLFTAFRDFDYRFVKRFLFFDQESAEKELKKYMHDWCKGRRSIRDYLMQGLTRNFNGVYTDTFIFQFDTENRQENEKYINTVFETLSIPHTFEDYNRKHCWWGAIPGCFRANITMPLKGIDQLGDLLILTEDANV